MQKYPPPNGPIAVEPDQPEARRRFVARVVARGLTEGQALVVWHLCRGETTLDGTARALRVVRSTVKNHRSHAIARLVLRSPDATGLVLWAWPDYRAAWVSLATCPPVVAEVPEPVVEAPRVAHPSWGRPSGPIRRVRARRQARQGGEHVTRQ